MATKHEQILDYIATLSVGSRISVRGIAKAQQVSEGTAYRAIKDAEAAGLVSSIPRVGTIRIESRPVAEIDWLSFRDLLQLIDAKVLGGSAGLKKHLDKFVIGAMMTGEMVRYITPNALVIIGNREDAQKLALQNGAAVLITGGFSTTDDVIHLANEAALPVLQTTHDTFSVATMINRALSDQAIKQDIMTVASILTPLAQIRVGQMTDTVSDFNDWRGDRANFIVPVVAANGRFVGLVSAEQVAGKKPSTTLDRVMLKNPATVRPYLSITTVGHTMQGNGLSLLPVVDDDWTLIGVVTRERLFSSLSEMDAESAGATIVDTIESTIQTKSISREAGTFLLHTTPMMTNKLGTMSFGTLNEAINIAVTRVLFERQLRNVLVESIALRAFRPVPLESDIQIVVQSLEFTMREGTLDVSLMTDGLPVAKALVTCQLIERNIDDTK